MANNSPGPEPVLDQPPELPPGYATPIHRQPFSNGTEGYGWQANWCDRCLVDAPFRNTGKGSGCPLLLVAFCGWTPGEWLDGPRDELGRYSIADKYHCLNFKPEGWRNPEPRPIPRPPGQGDLFDPEPFRGPRSLTSEPLPVRV